MHKLILLLALVLPVFGQATGYVEVYNNFRGGSHETQVNFWVQGPLAGKVGWFGWALTSKSWSEGYAGFNFAPTKGVEVGVGAGVETDDSPARLGSYASFSRGRFFGIGIYENGGSGYWDRVYANYTLLQKGWFSAGAGGMHEAFRGFGPRMQFGIGKKITVWSSFLAKEGTRPTAMLAVQWNL